MNGEIPSLAERTASIPGLAPAKRPAPPAQMTIKRFSRPGPTAKALARLAENTKLAAARGEKEVPGSYIVMLEDGVFPYAYREANGEEHLVDRAGLTLAETATKLVGELGGDLIHVFTFGGGGFSANLTKEQAEELRRLPGIKQVEPDRIMDFSVTPSWGQDRINQRLPEIDGNISYKTPGGTTAHIYIIDSGVRGTHQEFVGRVGNGFSSLGLNPYEDRALLNGVLSGHGTHVAGTALGANFGIASTAILHSVRVSDNAGLPVESATLASVDWVRLNRTNPAVANMSLRSPEPGIAIGVDGPLTLAVKALIASGVTVVAAAGNDAADASGFTPARVPEAITVGASNPIDAKADFSNVGLLVDIFAPGVVVLSSFNTDDAAVAIKDGTSFAAPHVAGVAALYLSGHPGATPEEVHQNVVANATRDIITGTPSNTTNELLYANKEWLDADRIIVAGAGTLAGLNIVHPNGNVYDQVLMTGSTVTIHPDWNQVARCSWIDENDDIVMAEYAGMGNLKITLENSSGPAFPVKYNQAVQYMKGRAKFEIVGGGSNTFFGAFSVGRANAVDQSIFLSVSYDGKADIKSLSFLDTSKIASVLTGNGIYRGDAGIVGIDSEIISPVIQAPKLKITNRLVIRDIKAAGRAEARLLLSAAGPGTQLADFGGRPVIAGGDLVQTNGSRIVTRLFGSTDFSALVTNANVDSHGNATPPLPLNNARLGLKSATSSDVFSYSTLDALGFPVPPPGTTSPF